MAYGTELREVFRQAARTIDKILRGAKPGDIPYYQPTVFELARMTHLCHAQSWFAAAQDDERHGMLSILEYYAYRVYCLFGQVDLAL